MLNKLVDLDANIDVYDGSLRSLGVSGAQVSAIQTTAGGMVFLFMKFDNDLAANRFYEQYNQYAVNCNRLASSLKFYTSAGLRLPSKIAASDSDYYFNGNLITNASQDIIVPSSLERASDKTIAKLSSDELVLQDTYFALTKKLETDYSLLSTDEKNKTIFENIVDEKEIADAPSDETFFVSTNGCCAMVKKGGTLTVNQALISSLKQKQDIYGNKHDQASMNLIITTGDVVVTTDFDGLILAKGTISVEGNCSITANPSKVAVAMNAAASIDGATLSMTDFIINAGQYLVGGTGTETTDDGAITMPQLVTYRNWKRQ